MFDAITLSIGDMDFLKIRTVGDSGDLWDKYVEITTHLLLGDAGKLSFNFLSALDFLILLRKTGQNIYFQFFAGQKLYFRLLQDRLFISGYSNVEFGGHARLLFYFLGHTGQIIYFQVFCGQNIYFQKLPALPPPTPHESNGRPLSTYCAKREYYM